MYPEKECLRDRQGAASLANLEEWTSTHPASRTPPTGLLGAQLKVEPASGIQYVRRPEQKDIALRFQGTRMLTILLLIT